MRELWEIGSPDDVTHCVVPFQASFSLDPWRVLVVVLHAELANKKPLLANLVSIWCLIWWCCHHLDLHDALPDSRFTVFFYTGKDSA